MTDSFAIIGSGAWGISLALHTHALGLATSLYCPRPETAEALAKTRTRPALLPNVMIPDGVTITGRIDDLQADHWIVAVPTVYLRRTVEQLGRFRPMRGLISLTKGLEIGTFARPSQILGDAMPGLPVAVLSGPSHAEEVTRGLPTSLVIACRDVAYASEVQTLLGNERLRIYSSGDASGVEIAGAYKNVLAIAAGICDGLRLGDNAKAALITRGLVEMTRFGMALGAHAETFHGLAGMGDLIATCFSPHGRNRRCGERIGQGMSVSDAVGGPQVVEGFFTAKSLHEQSRRMDVELPIAKAVYELLYEAKPAKQAVKELLARQQRMESTW